MLNMIVVVQQLLKAFLLPALLAVMIAGCLTSTENAELSPEDEYWREWWLTRILADRDDFKKFERLFFKDSLIALASQPAQQKWLDEWWHKRDPDWTTEENEWRQYIDSLVAVADYSYHQPEQISKYYPPWDERGRYFIKLGPPDYTHQFCCCIGYIDCTVWTWFPRKGRNHKIRTIKFCQDKWYHWVAYTTFETAAWFVETLPAEYSPDQRDPIPFGIERIRFHHQGDSTDLWLAYVIPLEGLTISDSMSKVRSTFQISSDYPYHIDDTLQGNNISLRSENTYRLKPFVPGEGNLAMQVERFTLPSGSYRVGFKIDDLYDSTKGITGKIRVEIVPYVDPERQKAVSDPMLLAEPPTAVFVENDRLTRVLNDYHCRLTPLPSHVLEERTDSLRVYHEVYNLVEEINDSARVFLNYILYFESKLVETKPDTLLQYVVNTPHSSAGYYQAFSLAGLRKGKYFLAIETIDFNDPDNLDISNKRWTAVNFKIR